MSPKAIPSVFPKPTPAPRPDSSGGSNDSKSPGSNTKPAQPKKGLDKDAISHASNVIGDIFGGSSAFSKATHMFKHPAGKGSAGATDAGNGARSAKPKPKPKPRMSTYLTGDTNHLDPDLKEKLQILGKRIHKPIHSESGNRTYKEQAALYAAYQNGTGNLAAPPGTSNHEHGQAVDAYVDGKPLQEVAGSEAEKLGLGFPVGGEPWHVENVSGTPAP